MWLIVLFFCFLLPVVVKCSKKPEQSSKERNPPPTTERSTNRTDSSGAEGRKTPDTKTRSNRHSDADQQSTVLPSALLSKNTLVEPVPNTSPASVNVEGLIAFKSKVSTMNTKFSENQIAGKTSKTVNEPFLSRSAVESNTGFQFGMQGSGGAADTNLRDTTLMRTTTKEGVEKTQEETQKTSRERTGVTQQSHRRFTKDTQEGGLTNKTMASQEPLKTMPTNRTVTVTVDKTIASAMPKVGVTQASKSIVKNAKKKK